MANLPATAIRTARLSERSSALRTVGAPAGAFLLVASMTAFAFVKVVAAERRATEVAFQSAARDRTSAVLREIETCKGVVDSIGSFFDASKLVTEEDFTLFVSPFLARHAALSGLSWVPRIADDGRAAHEAEAQARHPGYRITQRRQQGEMVRREDADEYWPVRFIAPVAGNEAALGFDLASDPSRLGAVLIAGVHGEVTASPPLRLVQEKESSRGVVLHRPLYRSPLGITTAEDRERQFCGAIGGVFRADDLVARSLQSLAPAGVDFELIDATDPARTELLAQHWSRTRRSARGQEPVAEDALRSQTSLDVIGRRLRLDFTAAPGNFSQGVSPMACALLVLGILLALAIMTLTAVLQRANTRARRDAHRLKRLSQSLITTQENERHLLARELHDQLGQSLTALRMNMHLAMKPGGTERRGQIFAESNVIIDRVLDQVRTISMELRPTLLDDLGLEPALRAYLKREARRSGLEVEYTYAADVGRLPADAETATYRFVQEAVTNVIRHARATTIRVDLSSAENGIRLVIEDDGVGFDGAAAGFGADRYTSPGLLGMQERVQLVGGAMTIRSQPGRGTRVEASIPLAQPVA